MRRLTTKLLVTVFAATFFAAASIAPRTGESQDLSPPQPGPGTTTPGVNVSTPAFRPKSGQNPPAEQSPPGPTDGLTPGEGGDTQPSASSLGGGDSTGSGAKSSGSGDDSSSPPASGGDSKQPEDPMKDMDMSKGGCCG